MVEVAESRVLHCPDLSSIPEVSKQILLFSGPIKVLIFKGDLGAGKTTLIKQICLDLQVIDNVSSPTFSIVNEYLTEQGATVYHFDFYRIKNEDEAIDMGFDEYVYSNNYCLVEWPEKVAQLLPDTFVEVAIKAESSDLRIIELSKHE